MPLRILIVIKAHFIVELDMDSFGLPNLGDSDG